MPRMTPSGGRIADPVPRTTTPPDAGPAIPLHHSDAATGAPPRALVVAVAALLVLGVLPALASGGYSVTFPVNDPGAGAKAAASVLPPPVRASASTNAAPSSGGPRERSPGSVGPASAFNGTEPAPMGIADLGQVPGGGYDSYASTSFKGTIAIDSLSAHNASIPLESAKISFQLNAFLRFAYGGETFVYWVQDVLEVNTSSNVVDFFDNIWNSTSTSANSSAPRLYDSSVTGGGSIESYGNETYYADGASCALAGACATLSYPSTVLLQLNTSTSVSGRPQVSFLLDDAGGVHTFDLATFAFATGATDFQGFFVNSQLRSTCHCYGDVELVAGGPDSGYQTALSGTTSVELALDRWNGGNFEDVPDAYNHGEATAEGLSNVRVVLGADALGEPAAVLSNAPGPFGSLWGSGTVSVVGVSVVTGHSDGDLEVNDTPVAFVAQFVEITLLPGVYNLSVVSVSTYPLGPETLVPGEILTLEVGAEPVVFVPSGLGALQVWSVTLNGQTLNGTGILTFGEVVGIYSFSVGALSGRSPSPGGGSVNVTATGATVAIQWTSNQTGILAELEAILELKLGPVPLWAILLFLVVLGAIGAVLARRPPSRTQFVLPPE